MNLGRWWWGLLLEPIEAMVRKLENQVQSSLEIG